MRRYAFVYVIIFFMIITFLALPSLLKAEDTAKPAAQTAAPAAAQAPAPAQTASMAPVQSKTADISVYGEVRNINKDANSIAIQYYDYDSDEERSAEIMLNKDTKLDGAASIGDIRQNDWADVVYVISEGKNVAKSVSVEKEETEDQPPAGDTAGGTDTEEY